jgi:transposase
MDYTTKITETVDFLLEVEKKQSQAIQRDRVRFVRLLKSGEATTQGAAGQLIGLSERQSQRLWKLYREQGLEGLTANNFTGYWGKLSSVQISHLRQYLFDNQAHTLADIQAYLEGSLGVTYTEGGVSDLCDRLKIKLKTGRPVNVRQEPGAVESFKKNLQS